MNIVITKTNDGGYAGNVIVDGQVQSTAVGDTVSDVVNLLELHAL